MKKIEAIIPTSKLQRIFLQLEKTSIRSFSQKPCNSFMLQSGRQGRRRGNISHNNLVANTQLQITTTDEEARNIIDIIIKANRVGDVKISVYDIETTVRQISGISERIAI